MSRRLNPAFAEAQRRGAGRGGDVCAPSAGRESMFRNARSTGKLSAANRKLEAMPLGELLGDHAPSGDENWWDCIDVTRIDVSHNLITVIPADIGRFEGLLALNLSKNMIATLPLELFALATLATLDLSQNRLEAVDPAIAGLAGLLELNVAHNVLTALPDALPLSLEHLRLEGNQLRELPRSLGRLGSLSTLDAKDNQIAFIDAGAFVDMRRLEVLELSGNGLSELPPSVACLSALVILSARQNRLVAFPELPAAASLAQVRWEEVVVGWEFAYMRVCVFVRVYVCACVRMWSGIDNVATRMVWGVVYFWYRSNRGTHARAHTHTHTHTHTLALTDLHRNTVAAPPPSPPPPIDLSRIQPDRIHLGGRTDQGAFTGPPRGGEQQDRDAPRGRLPAHCTEDAGCVRLGWSPW
jgi:hypothetical protein